MINNKKVQNIQGGKNIFLNILILQNNNNYTILNNNNF